MTDALPDGFTAVVLAAEFIPISLATCLFTAFTSSAPWIILFLSNRVPGLFIHPVIDTPIRASRSAISLVASVRYLKFVYPAWRVPIIEPALAASKNSSLVLHIEPLISERLQNEKPDLPSSVLGYIPISLTTESLRYISIRGLEHRINKQTVYRPLACSLRLPGKDSCLPPVAVYPASKSIREGFTCADYELTQGLYENSRLSVQIAPGSPTCFTASIM